MTTKTLIIMTALAVVLSVAAVLMDSGRDSRAAWKQADQTIFPGLDASAEEVTQLIIESSSGVTTLTRQDERWTVVERGEYAGRSDEVGRLIFALAETRRTEPMTSTAENFGQLGLGGFEEEDSPTVRLTAKNAADSVLADLLVGDRRSQGVGEGWYVREPDEDQVWSVSGKLRTPKHTAEWLDTELFDLSRERVAEVLVEPAEGERVELVRQGPNGQAFDIANLPAGRTPKTPRSAAALLGSLANLRMSDVKPTADSDFPDTPTCTTTWWTRGGLSLRAELAEVGDELLCRFQASFDPSRAPEPSMGPPAPDQEEGQEPDESAPDEPEEDPPPTPEELQGEAADLNAKTAGWVFVLPSWKKSSFQINMDELLAPLPEPPPEEPEQAPQPPVDAVLVDPPPAEEPPADAPEQEQASEADERASAEVESEVDESEVGESDGGDAGPDEKVQAAINDR